MIQFARGVTDVIHRLLFRSVHPRFMVDVQTKLGRVRPIENGHGATVSDFAIRAASLGSDHRFQVYRFEHTLYCAMPDVCASATSRSTGE